MKRNKFNLSHYKLLTCKMGNLIPLTWFETLPGDTIQQSTSLLIRVSPLNSPVMHPVRVRVHHWFVPLRLIWEDFEDFITGGPDGDSAPVHPYTTTTITAKGVSDYLGLPLASYSGKPVSVLPQRAYSLIWNENYRDQDLQTERGLSTASGSDSTTQANTLASVCWEKDYFTTARTTEQKGAEVTIPLGTSAPVLGLGMINQTYATGPYTVYESGQSASTSFATAKSITGDTADTQMYVEQDASTGYPNIRADLEAATGISINDLRLATALQRYEENRAFYGSRYSEYLKYLGVRSQDSRLQQPEYLGGGRQVIQFSEVLQTAEGVNPLGTMAGHGIAAMRTNRYRRFIPEHGIIMTLLSVLPKTIYAQGVQRCYTRTVKEDYYQKELEHIGAQEVYNREIYQPHTDYDEVFGYQARYDEYRTIPSSVAGDFRDDLDHWHYARIFSSDPALNSTFVTAVPTTRVYADTANDPLLIMANHRIGARRILSKYGTPGVRRL